MKNKHESKALTDVIAERARQIAEEGWTLAHDDEHDEGQLAAAAACYAFHAAYAPLDEDIPYDALDAHPVPNGWPWSPDWWKPTSPRADLVKANALILAEIERLDRMEQAKNDQ